MEDGTCLPVTASNTGVFEEVREEYYESDIYVRVVQKRDALIAIEGEKTRKARLSTVAAASGVIGGSGGGGGSAAGALDLSPAGSTNDPRRANDVVLNNTDPPKMATFVRDNVAFPARSPGIFKQAIPYDMMRRCCNYVPDFWNLSSLEQLGIMDQIFAEGGGHLFCLFCGLPLGYITTVKQHNGERIQCRNKEHECQSGYVGMTWAHVFPGEDKPDPAGYPQASPMFAFLQTFIPETGPVRKRQFPVEVMELNKMFVAYLKGRSPFTGRADNIRAFDTSLDDVDESLASRRFVGVITKFNELHLADRENFPPLPCLPILVDGGRYTRKIILHY